MEIKSFLGNNKGLSPLLVFLIMGPVLFGIGLLTVRSDVRKDKTRKYVATMDTKELDRRVLHFMDRTYRGKTSNNGITETPELIKGFRGMGASLNPNEDPKAVFNSLDRGIKERYLEKCLYRYD